MVSNPRLLGCFCLGPPRGKGQWALLPLLQLHWLLPKVPPGWAELGGGWGALVDCFSWGTKPALLEEHPRVVLCRAIFLAAPPPTIGVCVGGGGTLFGANPSGLWLSRRKGKPPAGRDELEFGGQPGATWLRTQPPSGYLPGAWCQAGVVAGVAQRCPRDPRHHSVRRKRPTPGWKRGGGGVRLGSSVGWASDFRSGPDLAVREFEPRVGLCADSSEPGACFGFCVSLSLCPSPAHAHVLSLSVLKRNKP